ncbi:MAG TPA: aldolase/citrate lyase family protein [Gemmatimonadaceae bacterium]|nr:aldolase/citrate lyase family protein [Gemmatimonadaceae bacterium]
MVTIAAGTLIGGTALQQHRRSNPVIELLASKKPAFGLYAPANRGVGRGGRAGAGAAAQAGTAGAAGSASSTPAAAAPAPKTPAELAREAFAYKNADYIFDGSMERPQSFDQGLANISQFAKGMSDAGFVTGGRQSHPLYLKTPGIAADPKLAAERIARQLNTGAMGIVFVDVESADELKQGLAMMRFRSQGGVRPDDVGHAPAIWGMSEKEYREKADLWPLNPNGELLNFTIVESKEGIAKVREIAAVKGIGVLFPGAGTLRGVYSSPGPDGRPVRDSVAWEGAIQQVLSACREFSVPCGYPASEADIETRMKQGFSVFIIGWGEAGFRTVDLGRRASGR